MAEIGSGLVISSTLVEEIDAGGPLPPPCCVDVCVVVDEVDKDSCEALDEDEKDEPVVGIC